MMLYGLTDAGANIRLAQYIFAGFYLLTVIYVFYIYHRVCKVFIMHFVQNKKPSCR